MSIRVLVADDQALVRAGFRMILETQADIEVVGESADGAGAVEAAAHLAPDVVLMDIRMPEMDGIVATRTLTAGGRRVAGEGAGATSPGPRVIILTTYDLDEYVFEALEAGASGFLLKDVRPEDLVQGVRVVAAGDALLAPAITRRLIAEFAGRVQRHPVLVRDPRLDRLTPREREILGLVAKGLSNSEIASTAYVSENTVKTHVARIFDKLGLRDRAQAVIVAYEAGLVAPGSPVIERGEP
ncbi:MAG TPA: response regulator transcription factor [Acidimicrobiales bacterium]|nr:response regulator transcription factor [Acidimicrobiales bacterium]